MDISVVIPSHNRSDALALTLEYLARQLFAGRWEVIIADNNSSDDTAAVIEAHKKGFPVELKSVSEKIPGASAARNAGARIAQGDYLIFLDNDILTEPDFLQRHFDALRKYPDSWLNGQFVNLPEQEKTTFGEFRRRFFPVLERSAAVQEKQVLGGQNFSLPHAHFIALGGFDNDLQTGEDFDLVMRGREKLGIRPLIVPSIVVTHNDWAGWTFSDFCRRQEIYYETEFSFWQKHGDKHHRLELVRENLPVNRREDSIKLIVRKNIKRFLSNSAIQKILLRLSSVLEQSKLSRPLLWRLYEIILAGAIHRGFEIGRIKTLEANHKNLN